MGELFVFYGETITVNLDAHQEESTREKEGHQRELHDEWSEVTTGTALH